MTENLGVRKNSRKVVVAVISEATEDNPFSNKFDDDTTLVVIPVTEFTNAENYTSYFENSVEQDNFIFLHNLTTLQDTIPKLKEIICTGK